MDKDTLNDLGGVGGLPHLKGEIPSGSMVLVSYTASWWKPSKSERLVLGLNLNWVVVLGIVAK